MWWHPASPAFSGTSRRAPSGSLELNITAAVHAGNMRLAKRQGDFKTLQRPKPPTHPSPENREVVYDVQPNNAPPACPTETNSNTQRAREPALSCCQRRLLPRGPSCSRYDRPGVSSTYLPTNRDVEQQQKRKGKAQRDRWREGARAQARAQARAGVRER